MTACDSAQYPEKEPVAADVFALLLSGAGNGALKQTRSGLVRRSHVSLLFCVPNESKSVGVFLRSGSSVLPGSHLGSCTQLKRCGLAAMMQNAALVAALVAVFIAFYRKPP